MVPTAFDSEKEVSETASSWQSQPPKLNEKKKIRENQLHIKLTQEERENMKSLYQCNKLSF